MAGRNPIIGAFYKRLRASGHAARSPAMAARLTRKTGALVATLHRREDRLSARHVPGSLRGRHAAAADDGEDERHREPERAEPERAAAARGHLVALAM